MRHCKAGAGQQIVTPLAIPSYERCSNTCFSRAARLSVKHLPKGQLKQKLKQKLKPDRWLSSLVVNAQMSRHCSRTGWLGVQGASGRTDASMYATRPVAGKKHVSISPKLKVGSSSSTSPLQFLLVTCGICTEALHWQLSKLRMR